MTPSPFPVTAMKARFFLILIPFTLPGAACLADEPQTTEPPESASAAEPVVPATERERMRREFQEMRERMRRGEEVDREAMREHMMARRAAARGNWWENDDLTGKLSLSEEQEQRLGELHEASAGTRREAVSRQRELQRDLNAALAEGDADKARQLLDARADAAVELQRAEDEWLNGVLEILNRDQLQTLHTEHPRALGGRRAPGGMMREF